MQARSSRVQDWSNTIVPFVPFRRFSLLFSHSISILLRFVPWEFASSHPLFSISNRTKCRTVTPAGHLRYRVFLTWIVSSCFVWSAFARCRDPARFSASWTAASPSGSSSSHKLRLTKSSKVKFRAPKGKAKGGHCGLTSRKWRLRSSSDRKRPGTIRYTSRCSFTSGKSGGDVATLHTGHALAPLLNRLTIQPLQTEYRFDMYYLIVHRNTLQNFFELLALIFLLLNSLPSENSRPRCYVKKRTERGGLVTLLEFSTLPEGQTNGWTISRTRSRYSRSRYGTRFIIFASL